MPLAARRGARCVLRARMTVRRAAQRSCTRRRAMPGAPASLAKAASRPSAGHVDPLRLARKYSKCGRQLRLVEPHGDDRLALRGGALELLADVRGSAGVMRQQQHQRARFVDGAHDGIGVKRPRRHVARRHPAVDAALLEVRGQLIGSGPIGGGVTDEERACPGRASRRVRVSLAHNAASMSSP